MEKFDLKKNYLDSFKTDPRANQKGKLRKKIKENQSYQFVIFGLIICLAEILIVAGILPASYEMAIAQSLIYSIVSIGFCLLLGYSGLASLGTAGFIGVGSYMAYYMMQGIGLDYITTLIATLIVSIIIGVAVGFISLRIEGIYLAIMTLAFSEMIVKLLKTLAATIKITASNITLFWAIPMNTKFVFFLIVVMFVLMTALVANLIKSPTGRAMVAMKSSTSAAQAMGISLMKYRLLAFVISIIYAAVAGVLYMLYYRAVVTATSTLFTLSTSLYILGAVIIGGYKSLWGATAGTFFIYALDTMVLSRIKFFADNPTIIVLLSGVLMIVIVMYYPGGFAQIIFNLRYAYKRRKLEREARYHGKQA